MTVLEGSDVFTPLGLDLEGITLDVERALELARSIGHVARSHQWWAGDLLVAAEAALGEDEWPQVEAELGVEPKTSINWAYVARNVERDRRREELTFSHHAEVARLSPAQQVAMLDSAVAGRWSVRELRGQVAKDHPTSAPDPDASDEQSDAAEARALVQAVRTHKPYLAGRLVQLDGLVRDRWPRWTKADAEAVRTIVEAISE